MSGLRYLAIQNNKVNTQTKVGIALESKKKALQIAEFAQDKKADNVVILDIRKPNSLCDFFVICSANSTRKTKAIADGIIDGLKAKDINLRHKEGYQSANWILLDYSSVIVHIFYDELRKFYNLEHLWADGKKLYPSQSKTSKSKLALSN